MEIIIKAKPYINKKNIGGPLPCICLSVHNLLQYSLEKYLQYSAWSITNIAEKKSKYLSHIS